MRGNLYNIDFRLWVVQWLPSPLRKGVLANLIWCLIYPIVYIYIQFIGRIESNERYARYDTSKGSLRRLLNWKYSTSNFEVETTSGGDIEYEAYYIEESGADCSYIGSSWIDAPYSGTLITIHAPVELSSSENEIRDIVSRYILIGYTFSIIFDKNL